MDQTEYIDSHAHIASEEFAQDLDAVLERIRGNHISRVMIVCTQTSELPKAFQLQSQEPDRFQVAYGIHPEDADTAQERMKELETLAEDPRISAIGEIGLDCHWRSDNKETQKQLFIAQIQMAKKVHKPILVHSRDAMQETYDIMKEYRCRGLMHCYSGSPEMAAEFTKLGYYLAFGGAVTFRNSKKAQETVRQADPLYLLSETDCPYMSPEPKRGTRNEPSNIPLIVNAMAVLRGIEPEAMAKQIEQNYRRFLNQ